MNFLNTIYLGIIGMIFTKLFGFDPFEIFSEYKDMAIIIACTILAFSAYWYPDLILQLLVFILVTIVPSKLMSEIAELILSPIKSLIDAI